MIVSLDWKENALCLLRMDWLAFVLQLLLLTTGVLFVRHAGMDYGGISSYRWVHQLLWIGLGLLVYFSCVLLDYRELAKKAGWIYLGGIVMLLLVLLVGKTVNGCRSVLSIWGMTLQVSEPMKPIVILFASWLLSHPLLDYFRVPRELLWIGVVMLPVILILLQPDCGTALVYLPITFVILFLNRLSWKWMLGLLLLGALLSPLCYQALRPYQKLRVFVCIRQPADILLVKMESRLPDASQAIRNWLDGEIAALSEKRGTTQSRFSENGSVKPPPFQVRDDNAIDDWNARQALNSVGSGGATGVGYGKGIQHTLGFLPRYVAPTDFIFSVIAEETGFVGCALVLLCELGVILLGCRTAFRSQDAIGSGIALGGATLYATHLLVNVGMNVGWMPIIGIPLPFVSYGGSFMIGIMAMAGLMQSVHTHREPSPEGDSPRT